MTDAAEAMIRCISPIDGSLFAERPALPIGEARAAAGDAARAGKEWARRPLEERIRAVEAGVEELTRHPEDAAVELAHMMGRPVRYGGEFAGVRERASHMCGIAAEALAPIRVESSERFERRIEREPHGAALVIAPWNYPYLTAINTVAPALVAGNAVVLKHASQTPLAGERMERAFAGSGMPEGVFRNLFLDRATTAALIAEGRFGLVNFTGSVEGGRSIERAAAGTFTALNLELGGKDPGYVAEDADVGRAAEGLMDGAMFNSGQCCCGIERVYVHSRVWDDFVAAAVDAVRRQALGNPLAPETTLGPMAQARFADGARRQVRDAVASGARALIDPGLFPADDGGAYLMPQVLVDVDHSMDVMREENFGPVVGLMRVGSDEEAIALMNDSDYGLTASLWTSDAGRAASIGARIETGTVFMNRADYVDPALCWTGCKNTGRGGGMSVIGYHNLTRPKSYHLKKSAE